MSTYIYEDGAIHHDHHKEMTINVSDKTDIAAMVKAFMADDAQDAEEVPADKLDEVLELPEVLCSSDAKALHTKLQQADMVDAHWQPVALSNAEKGTLAEYIADKLSIKSKWKLFGALWKVDAETLRTAKARGLEQDKTWEFRNKLDKL
jgi:hypothetical protein